MGSYNSVPLPLRANMASYADHSATYKSAGCCVWRPLRQVSPQQQCCDSCCCCCSHIHSLDALRGQRRYAVTAAAAVDVCLHCVNCSVSAAMHDMTATLKQERHPVDAPDCAVRRPEQARFPGLLRVQGPAVQEVREPRHCCHRRRRGLYREGALSTATQKLVLPATVPMRSHTMRLLGHRPRKTFHAPPGTSSQKNRLYT
jgi:hypothetical protein